ncbi:MAG TPA: hypothetical protein DEB05_11300 [Firmicutes bacterium]|nr:hypothetical protein [Bacillota bacterium]
MKKQQLLTVIIITIIIILTSVITSPSKVPTGRDTAYLSIPPSALDHNPVFTVPAEQFLEIMFFQNCGSFFYYRLIDSSIVRKKAPSLFKQMDDLFLPLLIISIFFHFYQISRTYQGETPYLPRK